MGRLAKTPREDVWTRLSRSTSPKPRDSSQVHDTKVQSKRFPRAPRSTVEEKGQTSTAACLPSDPRSPRVSSCFALSSTQLMTFYVDSFRNVLRQQLQHGSPEVLDTTIVFNFLDSIADIIGRLREALELRDREIAVWRAEHDLYHDTLTVLARQLQSGGSSPKTDECTELSVQAMLDLVSNACYKHMAGQSVLSHNSTTKVGCAADVHKWEAELAEREAKLVAQELLVQRANDELAARSAEVTDAHHQLDERQERCERLMLQQEDALRAREQAVGRREEMVKQLESLSSRASPMMLLHAECQCDLPTDHQPAAQGGHSRVDEDAEMYAQRKDELLAREERLQARACTIERELRRRAQQALDAEVRAQLLEQRLHRLAEELEQRSVTTVEWPLAEAGCDVSRLANDVRLVRCISLPPATPSPRKSAPQPTDRHWLAEFCRSSNPPSIAHSSPPSSGPAKPAPADSLYLCDGRNGLHQCPSALPPSPWSQESLFTCISSNSPQSLLDPTDRPADDLLSPPSDQQQCRSPCGSSRLPVDVADPRGPDVSPHLSQVLNFMSSDFEEAQRMSTTVEVELQRHITQLTGGVRCRAATSQVMPIHPKVTLSSRRDAAPRQVEKKGESVPLTNNFHLETSNEPSQHLFALFEDQDESSHRDHPILHTDPCRVTVPAEPPLRDISNVSRRRTRRTKAVAVGKAGPFCDPLQFLERASPSGNQQLAEGR
eukprot:GGOE01018500.1.p1 GENE.GGOE01018500.1~~GGOE01018500.1.p1  ORF type:complete len:801 (+),score=112.52 GGOE01018500.1:245-2404(+)